MIKKLNTKWVHLTFVLRHRWEKGGVDNYVAFELRKNLELGIWFKKYKAVGKNKGSVKKLFCEENLVNSYMIGINFIVGKMWVSIDSPRVLKIKIDDI